jgi:hypothetical protein
MPNQKKAEPSLGKAIENFTGNLSSLREFLNLVNPFLSEQTDKFVRENLTALIPIRLAMATVVSDSDFSLSQEQESNLRNKFGAEIKLEHEPGAKSCSISIMGEHGKQFRAAVDGMSIKADHQNLLTRNCLISLISSAEWFLSQILRNYFEANHDSAAIKEKTLTLDDLRKIGSIEEAENFLITSRIDEIMWGGYEDWVKYLRNNVKLSMSYLERDEALIVEVFQRRNVLVHNNGVVNQTYISKVPAAMRDVVRLGEGLKVDAEYVNCAIDLIERNFVLIAAELWKKLEPTDEERASVLTDLAIKALENERYGVAEAASEFTMNDKRLSEKRQLIGKLNFWQTKKWAGQFETLRPEIEAADFSAKDDLCQLARFVLLDRVDDAVPLIEDQLNRNKLGVKQLEEWPIFRVIRNDPRVDRIMKSHRADGQENLLFPVDAINAPAAAAIKGQDNSGSPTTITSDPA